MGCEQMGDIASLTNSARLPSLDFYYDIAKSKGLKWTPMRKQVFELLWRSNGPWGPYDVVDALGGGGARIYSNSIYRTLRTLEEFNLVVQVFTTRRFLVSPDPRLSDWGVFHCTECRSQTLIALPSEAGQIREVMRAHRFAVRETIIECTGMCSPCAESKAAESAPKKPPYQPPPRTRESIRAYLVDKVHPEALSGQDH